MTKRKQAAVYRDISKMERFGLMKTHQEVSPAHGRHKIVDLVEPELKLEVHL